MKGRGTDIVNDLSSKLCQLSGNFVNSMKLVFRICQLNGGLLSSFLCHLHNEVNQPPNLYIK
jgi:hypothetical protein